jgi:hypothetical protein
VDVVEREAVESGEGEDVMRIAGVGGKIEGVNIGRRGIATLPHVLKLLPSDLLDPWAEGVGFVLRIRGVHDEDGSADEELLGEVIRQPGVGRQLKRRKVDVGQAVASIDHYVESTGWHCAVVDWERLERERAY